MSEGGDWPETIPVTPEVARHVVDEVARHLPDGWQLMPIGGTYLGLGGFDDGAGTTKDVDLVATVHTGGDLGIPEYDDVLAVAREHSDHVRGLPRVPRQSARAVPQGRANSPGRVARRGSKARRVCARATLRADRGPA